MEQTRSYSPVSRCSNVLVWVHGGSWANGSITAWDCAFRSLSELLTVPLIAVSHTSAERASFPVPVLEVARAVADIRAKIGPDAMLIGGGDSSGGTLMAHVALRHPELVDAQVLVYPPMDPTCAGPSFADPGFPSREHMRRAWARFAGSAVEERMALASPLTTVPHAVAGAAFLLVGAQDPVRYDVELYANHLNRAGVPTTMSIRDDVHHGDFLAPARQGHNAVHSWIADRCTDLIDRRKR